MNELVKVENGKIVISESVGEQYKEFNKLKTKMELLDKEIKQQLKDKMEELGIEKFNTDYLSATYVKPTTRVTLDSKKLKEDMPDIYDKYSKVSEVASSIRLTISD